MSQVSIAKCPNDDCPFYKETGKRYHFPTRKTGTTQCGKCGKEFKI